MLSDWPEEWFKPQQLTPGVGPGNALVIEAEFAEVTEVMTAFGKLGVPAERVVVTVDRHANTSAASVPLALDAARRDGRIQAGQTVLMQGVGGGFTWGSVLARM